MKRACDSLEPLCDDLLLGEVDAQGMKALEEHLSACPVCRAKLVARYREDRALRELAAEPHISRLSARIRGVLNGEVPLPPPETAPARQAQHPPPRQWLRWVVSTAVLVLVALGIYWLTRPTPFARLEVAEGDVTVEQSTAEAGQNLYSGQQLVTGAGSQAVVQLPDQTRMTLGPETAVTFHGGDSTDGSEIALGRGVLSADVSSQKRPLHYSTPHGLATVLGTRLTLVVAEKSTRLEVRQGSVRLASADGRKSVEVKAGQYSVAAQGADLAVQRLTDVPGLPPGAWVIYHEDFKGPAGGWQGSRQAAPLAASGEQAMLGGPVSEKSFRRTLFAETRSPWHKPGWRIGAHTYLRFRYLAEKFTARQGMWLTIKHPDGSNYGGTLKDVVADRWQTVTLRVSDFVLVLKPPQRPVEGDTLHQLCWFGSFRGDNPPADPRLWIDDVVLFETPSALPTREVARLLFEN